MISFIRFRLGSPEALKASLRKSAGAKAHGGESLRKPSEAGRRRGAYRDVFTASFRRLYAPQAPVLILALLSIALGSCSSSGPKTEYYSLFPSKNVNIVALSNKNISIGVGAVELPEYVDHPGIVSVSASNRVIVSGYNAWAGDLNENISRVLATNLSTVLEIDQ